MIKKIFTPFLFTLLLSVGFTSTVQARAAIDLIDLDVQIASQAEEAAAVNQEKEVSPVNDYQAQKESQKELRKLMRQIESLETEIEELETQAQAISEQMHTTNDADELMQLQAELDKISHRQEEAMLEWEELSEQV